MDGISGTFQLGMTAAAIENIPGARERVFTKERNGYLWTPLTRDASNQVRVNVKLREARGRQQIAESGHHGGTAWTEGVWAVRREDRSHGRERFARSDE